MDDLTSVLDKINMKIANPIGLAPYPYSFNTPCIYNKNEKPPTIGGVFYLVEHPPHKNSEKSYNPYLISTWNGPILGQI